MDDWMDGWVGGLFCSGHGPRDRNLARATPHATRDALHYSQTQKRIVCQKLTLTLVCVHVMKGVIVF